MAREDCVDVHLVEEGSLVVDLAGGDVFEFGGELGGGFAAMGFDDADDDVFATLTAANALREHAERFTDAGRVAEKYLEAATCFLGIGSDQPVLWAFSGCGIGRQRRSISM